MFTLRVEYLTGYAVATDVNDRERAEWPPHPARLFMALAAAWFETGRDAKEEAALRWLESLPAPQLQVACPEPAARTVVTQYVPVNDKAGPSAATLQSAPSFTRSKQPRTTPRVRLGRPGTEACGVCFMWESQDAAEPVGHHHEAMERLAARVNRIGHSSSLVHLSVIDAEDQAPTHRPGPGLDLIRVRAVASGTLDYLDDTFGEGRMRDFLEASEAVRAAKVVAANKRKRARAEKQSEKEAVREAEAGFLELAGTTWKEGLQPEAPRRPNISRWTSYCRVHPEEKSSGGGLGRRGPFGRDLLVFRVDNGPHADLVSAVSICAAVRGLLIATACEVHGGIPASELPGWLTGHTPDGAADRSSTGHVAVLPLPDVAHRHADGHLLGIALALPAGVEEAERVRWLGPLLFDARQMRPRAWKLKAGKAGDWTLNRTDEHEDRRALQPERWGGGGAAPSRTWRTVTPIVLDRFPKTDRHADPAGWRAELADTMAASCLRANLIDDASEVTIDVDTTAWVRGVPRSTAKRRRYRGPASPSGAIEATAGGGFLPYPARGTRAPRLQVHAELIFDQPIHGPLLLGAGRFGGYGLCMPEPVARLAARPEVRS